MDKYEKARKFHKLAVHHATFNDECLQAGVFPLGMKAYATCATLGADDNLKKE